MKESRQTDTSHKQSKCNSELARARESKTCISRVPETPGRFFLEGTIDENDNKYQCSRKKPENRRVRKQR
jgi:hypothetical protein